MGRHKKKIIEGVQLKASPHKGTSDGLIITNNFISKEDDKICHVRPHASYRDYREGGSHADELPTPIQWINRPDSKNYSNQWMTKQSFWINNTYINEQIKELLD